MPGLLGKKIGMTSVFSADGKNIINNNNIYRNVVMLHCYQNKI